MTTNGYSDPAQIAATAKQASLALVRSQLKPAVAAAYGKVKRQRLFPVVTAAVDFRADTAKNKEDLNRHFTGAAGEAAAQALESLASEDGHYYYGAIESIQAPGVSAPYAPGRQIFGL